MKDFALEMDVDTANDNPPIDEALLHDSAVDRTLMAEERTFSAWMRSGLAAEGAAVAIVKMLPDSEPRWLVHLLGIILSVVGAIAFAIGFWGYRAGSRYWSAAMPRAIPLWLMGVLTVLLMVGAAMALYLIMFD